MRHQPLRWNECERPSLTERPDWVRSGVISVVYITRRRGPRCTKVSPSSANGGHARPVTTNCSEGIGGEFHDVRHSYNVLIPRPERRQLRLLPRGALQRALHPVSPGRRFCVRKSARPARPLVPTACGPFARTAHGLAFTPAGCSGFSEAEDGGEYLTIPAIRSTAAALSAKMTHAVCRKASSRAGFTARAFAPPMALRRLLLFRRERSRADRVGAGFVPRRPSPRSGHRSRPPLGSLAHAAWLKLIEGLIEARLAEPLAISDMAAACGLSTGFFPARVHGCVGQTPHHY